MRQTVNIDESDPNAPMVQLDWVPGLAAPAYLNIGSMLEPSLIEFGMATVEDMHRVIAKRVTVTNRITARVEDLTLKLEWLKSHRIRDDETIAQVCARLEKVSA